MDAFDKRFIDMSGAAEYQNIMAKHGMPSAFERMQREQQEQMMQKFQGKAISRARGPQGSDAEDFEQKEKTEKMLMSARKQAEKQFQKLEKEQEKQQKLDQQLHTLKTNSELSMEQFIEKMQDYELEDERNSIQSQKYHLQLLQDMIEAKMKSERETKDARQRTNDDVELFVLPEDAKEDAVKFNVPTIGIVVSPEVQVTDTVASESATSNVGVIISP